MLSTSSDFPKFIHYKCIANICALLLLGVSAAEAKGAAKAPGADKALSAICPAGNSGKKASKADKQRATLLKRLQAIAQGGDINAADKKGQTALMHAAALDNRPAVCWLVAKGADVNLKTASGKTAADYATHPRILDLLKACAYERSLLPPDADYLREKIAFTGTPEETVKEVVSLTNEYGVSWDAKKSVLALSRALKVLALIGDMKEPMGEPDKNGIAIERGSAESVAYLVRHGYKLPEIPESVLAQATPEKVQLLLALGAKFQPAGMKYVAAACDDVPLMKKLIKENPQLQQSAALLIKAQSAEMARLFLSGAQRPDLYDILLADPDADTVYSMSKSAAAMLISESGTDVKDEKNASLLSAAISRHCTGLALALIEAGADAAKCEKALHSVISESEVNTELLEALLKAGALAHSDEHADSAILERALSMCHKSDDYTDRCSRSHMQAVQMLLEAGAKAPKDILVDFKMVLYMGDLPDAALPDFLELLIKRGADIHVQKSGPSALSWYGGRRLDVTKRLIEADSTEDMSGALNQAIHFCHIDIVEYLLSKGAQIDESACTAFCESKGSEADLIKLGQLLQKNGGDLAHAVKAGSWDITPNGVKAAGRLAKVDIKSLRHTGPHKESLTPLMVGDIKLIDGFLALGCDINAQDQEGKTKLHRLIDADAAYEVDLYEELGKLLYAGIRTDIRNNEGKTALMVAKASSGSSRISANVVKILEKYGAKE